MKSLKLFIRTFPSCPASVLSGVQPGWLQTFAMLSYAPVNRKWPSLAAGIKQEVRSRTKTIRRRNHMRRKLQTNFLQKIEKWTKWKQSKSLFVITLEADSRQQVVVGGDCVQTLPVPQLPNPTGVISTSCGQVMPDRKQKTDEVQTRLTTN